MQNPNNFHETLLAQAKDLTKADLQVGLALAALGEAQACVAYQDEIAHCAGLSLRQTHRSLNKLETCNIIRIVRKRAALHTYHFCQTNMTKTGQVEMTHESHQIPCTNTNTTKIKIEDKNEKSSQLTLISDKDTQNLRALDIEPQQVLDTELEDTLRCLDINPALKQKFLRGRAHPLCERYTPAEILLAHDAEGLIRENLVAWRIAWEGGDTDLGCMTPALIWCKIVEGQSPPVSPPAEESLPQQAPFTRVDHPATTLSPLETDPLTTVWAEIQQDLQGQMTRATYSQHIAGARLIGTEAGCYTIEVRNELSRLWLEERLKKTIMGAVRRATETVAEVQFVSSLT